MTHYHYIFFFLHSDEQLSYNGILDKTKESLTGTWHIINRDTFLENAMEELQDEEFDKLARFEYLGEEGVDSGGLLRDFFTNFFRLTPLIEDNTLSSNAVHLQCGRYRLLGKIFSCLYRLTTFIMSEFVFNASLAPEWAIWRGI